MEELQTKKKRGRPSVLNPKSAFIGIKMTPEKKAQVKLESIRAGKKVSSYICEAIEEKLSKATS